MTAVLRWTGLGKLVSFYRYFSLNGPRVTTATGVALLLGITAIRLYWLFGSFQRPFYPAYLAAYFALVAAVAVGAAVAMAGRSHGLTRIGWGLGGVVSAASFAMYVAGRTLGLPGLPQLVGQWHYALGTFALALAALFLALHFSVLTGVSVAHPQRRQWQD